jgi:hypothetical protein
MAPSEPLDAYSQVVASVAEQLTPKVASLRVPRRGSAESLGSAGDHRDAERSAGRRHHRALGTRGGIAAVAPLPPGSLSPAPRRAWSRNRRMSRWLVEDAV